jgi:hypothetical protein
VVVEVIIGIDLTADPQVMTKRIFNLASFADLTKIGRDSEVWKAISDVPSKYKGLKISTDIKALFS